MNKLLTTKEKYEKLKKFATSLNYKVIDTDCDSWCYNSGIICNNSRRKLENRIIYLAHECGHATLFLKTKKYYYDVFPGFQKQGIKYKISEIEQEVLAWHEGLEILKKLNISIDLKKYSKIKIACLQGYII